MDFDVIERLRSISQKNREKNANSVNMTNTADMTNAVYAANKLDESNAANRDIRSALDVENIIEGYIYEDEEGKCFIIENSYPLTYIYGGCSLGDILAFDQSSIRRLSSDIDNEHINDLDIRDLIFFDIETTGLSGGVGTVAFLVGTGFFEEDAFVVRQYFMRDYDEEVTMLNALNKLFGSHKGIITFNGRAFDWNIIQSRFTYNRIRPRFGGGDIIHVDLLIPARRIWKEKLQSCSLSSLEENILDEYRTDDIPGMLIPQVYFKYLLDRDARDIKRVLKHNELDILSMVSLFSKINSMLDSPLCNTSCEQELIGVGRIFESAGETDNLINCYEKCMESEDLVIKNKALKKLSQVYKRNGDYQKAICHWESMAMHQNLFSIYSLVELAKYYEHKAKDPEKALEMTEKAVQIYLRMGIGEESAYLYELKKRLERLRRKTGKRQVE